MWCDRAKNQSIQNFGFLLFGFDVFSSANAICVGLNRLMNIISYWLESINNSNFFIHPLHSPTKRLAFYDLLDVLFMTFLVHSKKWFAWCAVMITRLFNLFRTFHILFYGRIFCVSESMVYFVSFYCIGLKKLELPTKLCRLSLTSFVLFCKRHGCWWRGCLR